MTENVLKSLIRDFCKDWTETGGDRYEEPEPADWNRYGELEAHMLRFCRSLLTGKPDQQWAWSRFTDAETRDRLWREHWPEIRRSP